MVTRCLQTYLRDPEANADTLIRYAEKLGNGAVFKRLGFLVSQIPENESLSQACRQRLTAGNAKLDPALPCRRLVKGCPRAACIKAKRATGFGGKSRQRFAASNAASAPGVATV